MTTAITTSEATHTAATPKSWKLVATFVAGLALAGGVAVGIHAVQDDSSPARTTHPAAVSQSAILSDAGCRVHPGPC